MFNLCRRKAETASPLVNWHAFITSQGNISARSFFLLEEILEATSDEADCMRQYEAQAVETGVAAQVVTKRQNDGKAKGAGGFELNVPIIAPRHWSPQVTFQVLFSS